jgi:type II secretory pathway pseudopilin PulG
MRVARAVLISVILASAPAMAQENADAQAAVQLFGTFLNAIAGAMSQGAYCSNGGNLCPNNLCCPYGTACMADGGCGQIGARVEMRFW